MRLRVIAAGVAVLGTCVVWLPCRPGGVAALTAKAPVPVVVELFSSEGCSSCPPADAYLMRLDETQPVDGVTVLALEEHVDYWDRLGWRDPFGSTAFSDRQNQYARVLPGHSVFTPELVLDGRAVMSSGDEAATRERMKRAVGAPRARVVLHREGPRVSVDVREVPSAGADDVPEVWLAISESGLATDVPAGENAGHRLAHGPIVRRLGLLGRASSGAFHGDVSLDLEPSWRPAALRIVAFVQLRSSRRIVGAGAL